MGPYRSVPTKEQKKPGQLFVVRELAIIDRMRARILPMVPTGAKHLNGASTRT